MLKSYNQPDFLPAGGGVAIKQTNDGATLPAGTYFADFGPGVEGATSIGPAAKWDATFAASITWEGTGFASASAIEAVGVAADWSAEPDAAIVIAGGTAGHDRRQWSGVASYRCRAVIVVGTAGVFRLAVTCKGR